MILSSSFSVTAMDLPKDVMLMIFTYLNIGSLGVAAQICKTWKRYAEADLIWSRYWKGEWKQQYGSMRIKDMVHVHTIANNWIQNQEFLNCPYNPALDNQVSLLNFYKMTLCSLCNPGALRLFSRFEKEDLNRRFPKPSYFKRRFFVDPKIPKNPMIRTARYGKLIMQLILTFMLLGLCIVFWKNYTDVLYLQVAMITLITIIWTSQTYLLMDTNYPRIGWAICYVPVLFISHTIIPTGLQQLFRLALGIPSCFLAIHQLFGKRNIFLKLLNYIPIIWVAWQIAIPIVIANFTMLLLEAIFGSVTKLWKRYPISLSDILLFQKLSKIFHSKSKKIKVE